MEKIQVLVDFSLDLKTLRLLGNGMRKMLGFQ